MSSGNSYITNLWYVSTREDNGEVKVRLGFQANDSVGTAQLMYEQEDISDFDPTSGLMMYMSNNEGMFPDDYYYQIVEIYGGLTSEASGVMEITGDGTLELGYTYTIQAYDGGTPTVTMEFEPALNTNPKAKDLASGTLASSISASTTNLLVYVGDGSATAIKGVWPDTPFYATLMPASPSAGVPNSLDSEIVKVTAVGNDQIGNTTLTVVRGQKGTTTKAFSEGDVVTNAIYAGDAVLLSEEGTSETETPWVGTDDIENGAVKVEKIDWDTIIPQSTGTTYALPMKYKGKTIYARRFAGTFNLSGATRVQFTLLGTETNAKIVRTIGWFGPFAGASNAEVNQTFGADGLTFTGYTQVVASSSAGICLRAMYNTTNTGAYYDTVVYWIRDT